MKVRVLRRKLGCHQWTNGGQSSSECNSESGRDSACINRVPGVTRTNMAGEAGERAYAVWFVLLYCMSLYTFALRMEIFPGSQVSLTVASMSRIKEGRLQGPAPSPEAINRWMYLYDFARRRIPFVCGITAARPYPCQFQWF